MPPISIDSISYEEFSKRVNFKEFFSSKKDKYIISKFCFVEIVLEEWEAHKERLKTEIIEIFKKFDDNGDGVLTLDE